MKKFTSNRKAQQFFVLDLYSIFFFVIALIILLIVISLSYKNKDEAIENAIVGINFPHYVMNEVNSHEIEIEYCVEDKDDVQTAKMTIKEALIFYDWLLNEDDVENSCLSDYKNNLRLQLNDIFNMDFAKKTNSVFRIIFTLDKSTGTCQVQDTVFTGRSTSKLPVVTSHVFNFKLPTTNNDILFSINYQGVLDFKSTQSSTCVII